MEYGKKYNPGVPTEKRLIRTIQGWANVLALAEALKRADKAGDLTGEGILKKGFETFEGVDIGLGVAAADLYGHRPPGGRRRCRSTRSRTARFDAGRARRPEEPLAGKMGQRVDRLVSFSRHSTLVDRPGFAEPFGRRAHDQPQGGQRFV